MAAVVASERHLAEGRHLPMTDLVQDLAGLGISGGVGPIGLVHGEVGEDAARKLRRDPQRLQGRDDPVAPEDRAEPRDPGVGVDAMPSARGEHRQVRRAAVNPFVEQGM